MLLLEAVGASLAQVGGGAAADSSCAVGGGFVGRHSVSRRVWTVVMWRPTSKLRSCSATTSATSFSFLVSVIGVTFKLPSSFKLSPLDPSCASWRSCATWLRGEGIPQLGVVTTRTHDDIGRFELVLVGGRAIIRLVSKTLALSPPSEAPDCGRVDRVVPALGASFFGDRLAALDGAFDMPIRRRMLSMYDLWRSEPTGAASSSASLLAFAEVGRRLMYASAAAVNSCGVSGRLAVLEALDDVGNMSEVPRRDDEEATTTEDEAAAADGCAADTTTAELGLLPTRKALGGRPSLRADVGRMGTGGR